MNSVALSIGKITITYYAICIVTGALVAGLLILKESKKFGIKSDFVINLVFYCVLFGILGARIYYILFNLNYYLKYPNEIIAIWNGGLAIHGGIIAGLMTLVIYCNKYRVNILRMLDISSPYVLLAQAIGRWGNFFNKEAHGGIVSKTFLENIHIPKFIIDGMFIDGKYYHPTFFYESLLCILGCIILVLIRKIKKIKLGNIISLYLIWYGIVRFFIESLRTDSLMLGDLKMAQVISIIMIIVGIIMLVITSMKCNMYNKGKIKEKAKK